QKPRSAAAGEGAAARARLLRGMRPQDGRAVQGNVTIHLQLSAATTSRAGLPADRFGCDRRACRPLVLPGVGPRGTGRLRPSPGVALGRTRATEACPRAAT